VIESRTLEGRTAVVRSLADFLAARTTGEGDAGTAGRETERLARALAEAVGSYHAGGKTHGALRPSVFQISAEGTVTLLPGAGASTGKAVLQYASPEVAHGEAPTPASDVFSLSLVLLELFAGTPVRSGAEEEISALAEEGLASIPDGVPERLANLALRSAASQPEQRPTVALWQAALGEQPAPDAPRRGLRLLGACVVLLALGLGLSERRAAEARDRSTVRLNDARAVFEGLLLSTYDQLERVDELGPLAAAGERALALIEAAERSGDRPSGPMLAKALVWNGRAQRILDEPAAAAAHFERAIEVSAAPGGGREAVEVEVTARVALGELAVDQRDFKAARTHFGRAISLCESALGEEAAGRAYRIAHVQALIGIGDVAMSSGKKSAARALNYFSRARMALEDPEFGVESAALDVLVLRCDLGKLEANMAFQTGQRGRAIELLEGHVALAQDLIERDPGLERSRWTLARGADVLARAQREVGRPQEAVQAHRTSVEAWRLLREMAPKNVAWQREWAKSTSLLADSLRLVGQIDESVRLHRASIELMEAMMTAGELAPSFMLDVIQQELSSAEGLLSIGEVRRARGVLRDVRSRLSDVDPASLKRRRGDNLGIRANLVEAELMLSEGRWPGAKAKALTIMKVIQAEAMRGSDRGLRLDQARALLVSGAVAEVEGDSELATENRERALGLLVELRKERPADPELMALRARALFTLGRDLEAEKAIDTLDQLGFKDARLTAVRAAASALRR